MYRRTQEAEDFLIAVNPASHPVEADLPVGLVKDQPKVIYGHAGAFAQEADRWMIRLPGVSGGIYKLV